MDTNLIDTVLIIDFMNYVHRCRVGNLDGEYVLIYNFFRNLRVTIEQFQPSKVFFALEGHPKHRYDLYSDYKANRIIKTGSKQAVKNHILICSNGVQELLLLLPVTLAQHPSFEADDIIHALSLNMREENIIICSSDTDCIQILQQGYRNCKLYNPIKKEFLIAPTYPYVAFKTLTGDKSDNIKRLVSDKKALAYCNDPELLKKFMELEENRASVSINKQLVEFADVPLDEIIFNEGIRNFNKLKSEFQNMKFETIINPTSWKKYVDTFDCLKY